MTARAMRIYGASSFGVVTVFEQHQTRALNPRLDLLRLSPGGFTWGEYGSGNGDRQLALAILADAYDDEKALCLYEQFAERAIYTKSREAPFAMTLDQVLEHVEAIEKETG